MGNPGHGQPPCVRYGIATADEVERTLHESARLAEAGIVTQTTELEGISNGGERVRLASRRDGVWPNQRARGDLGPTRLRRSPRSRGAGAHPAGARGVLA